jgi:hypothetical protein
VWLRLPFAVIDAGTTLLLLSLFSSSRGPSLADGRIRFPSFIAAAAYWLHPLAMIFSAYHGNTDSAIAFSLLLSVWLLARGNVIGAGIAFGAGFWIKIPGVLAIPALLLLPQGWRKKALFLFAALLTALAFYVPALLEDTGAVCRNVFGYRGLLVATPAHEPIWGMRVLLLMFAPAQWRAQHMDQIRFFIQHEWLLAVSLLLLLVWLRRGRRSPGEVCATIAALYVIFYAFNDYWAYQYLAWSVPFWFFLPQWWVVPASLLASAYIYSLYWLYCGNPWLAGPWNYVAHSHWPTILISLRNLTMLFFFVSAFWILLANFPCKLTLLKGRAKAPK